MLGSRLFTGDRLRWVSSWLKSRLTAPRVEGPRHVFVAICDHFEPLRGGVSLERGILRVRAWQERYPALAASFRDYAGRSPRHTFFFPGEQYHPDLVEPLADLARGGFGEVEVHLHHDRDTSESLRESLQRTVANLAEHGLVSGAPGRPRWAFIHGNWCLANARKDGRFCGVDDELAVLFQTGCYADFTFPSSPDECQPALANAVWYPAGDVKLRRAYEHAERVRVGSPRRTKVLLLSGPLALSRRPKSLRLRIEGSHLTAKDPPTAARLATWLSCNVHITGRPDWTFLKLHTHGAPEREANSLLGEPQRGFHRTLARLGERGCRVYYVTAREMYNLARAAMDGRRERPERLFDYDVERPPVVAASRFARRAV